MEGLLKNARTSNKIKQKVIAAALGCSVSTISLYENGKRMPSLELVEKICDICGVSESEKKKIKNVFLNKAKGNLSFVKNILSESIKKISEVASNKKLSKKEIQNLSNVAQELSKIRSVINKSYLS